MMKNTQRENEKVNFFTTIRQLGKKLAGISFFLCMVQPAMALDKTVWSEGADYIAVEKADKNVNNSHPADIDPNKLYQVLKTIRVQEKESGFFDLEIFDSKDEYSSELFTRTELLKLSRHASRALAQANEKQDVVFSITGVHPKTLGKASLTTTGRIFVQGGKVNLIVGEYRVDLSQKYRQRGGYSDVAEKVEEKNLANFRLDTGERDSDQKDFQYLLESFQQIQGGNSAWIDIDVTQALASFKTVETGQANQSKQTKQTRTEVQQLSEKVESLEKQINQSNATGAAVAPNTAEVNVETRLKRLKALYEKGLIDESSYQIKIQKILDEI